IASWRSETRLASGAFGLVFLLAAFIALWPSISMWQFARQEKVTLSLGTYLAHAAAINFGGPHYSRAMEYATAPDGTDLVLDVWRIPKSTAGSLQPAVLRVHGGAWIYGRRGEMGEWNRWLNELGYHVFDVDYRLPPLAHWKDEVADVKCALGWVAANAAQY